MPDDPAVQAVFEALDEECASLTIPQLRGLAQVAVDACRRAVLASRPDAERWADLLRQANDYDDDIISRRDCRDLLAALADETARVEQFLDLLADVAAKAAPYGEQDGGFVATYILPTGCFVAIHPGWPARLLRLGACWSRIGGAA